jgi:hypothetical protein
MTTETRDHTAGYVAEIMQRVAELAEIPTPDADTAPHVRHEIRTRVEHCADAIGDAAARISGADYRPTYNGWHNRETWNAALWIDNDPGTYETARDIVRASRDDETGTYFGETAEIRARRRLRIAGDALQEWFGETFGPDDTAGPLSDAWTYAVAVADWYRIAEGIAEGLGE